MGTFELVVRGDRVLIGADLVPAAIGIRDGRIAEIAGRDAELPAERTIEAGAHAVVPGFIDLHVHFDNPGDSVTEDFAVGTANAALGGQTTVVDHPFTVPPTVTAAVLQEKIGLATAGARVDFGLWGGLTAEHLDEIPGMMGLGAAGFKAFLPDNDMGVTSATGEHLRRGFALAAGGTILVHAEHRDSLRELDERSRREGWKRDYSELAAARDASIEARAVREVLEIAEETGGAVHFVHLSVPETVDLVTAARARGVRASCEVAAHHLLLTADALREQGWPALCAPPLRERAEVEGMWDRLRAGAISAVVSDHCPYDPADKAAADSDAFAGPFGIQGIREFGPLFIDEALRRGWSLAEAVACLTTRPASLFGLGPAKGALALGADADLVLLDMAADWTVDAAGQVGDWRWTPYAGMRSRVSVDTTLLRGRAVVEGGELVGPAGAGRYLRMGGAR